MTLYQKNKNTKGFTLVEMMVAIAIIGVMTSAILVSVGSSKIKEEVRAAADELAGRIEEARHRALSGNTETANKACGFGVYLATSTQYRTFYAVSGTGACTTHVFTGSAQTPSQTFTNLKVSVSPTSQNIYFDVPFGHLHPASPVDISVAPASGGGGYVRHVCVSATGIVTVGDSCP